MGFISNLIKTGLVLGAVYTAWQASEESKKQTGGYDQDTFMRSFKDHAIDNSKRVVDVVKNQVTGKKNKRKKNKKTFNASVVSNASGYSYRVSDEGENGYTYKDAAETPKDAEPAEDKVSEVFETIREKAPEVIDKVQNFVEDVRDNAPEYKAKAQEFVEDVKEAAKKALDTDESEEDK